MSHKSPRHPGFKAAPQSQGSEDLTITCNGEPVTILLVDDDAECRMGIRDAISECKVSNDVHEARNGREALDFLHRRGAFANAPRPGLVYLDIEMPGLDRQSVLCEIKN